MRIIVISTPVFVCPPPGYSGLEQLAWQHAKGLAAKGHDVSLVAPDGSSCPNVRILAIGPAGQVNEQMAYDRYWKELLKCDVVIDHTWSKMSYLLKMEGRLTAPVLGVLHAPVNTMYQSLPPVDKSCFVCISQDQANHFQALFGREAKVAYNGIDLNHYKPMAVKRSKRFLFLARFSTIKGPDLAIEACKKAGVGLDLIGDTQITNEPELLERCKKMCDGEQIRLVGPASRGECVWWFSQAHALLHPNQRFREPFGLAPVEAQACGCPVIAWDYGAMRETIGGPQGYSYDACGVLIKSLDEMVFWINDWSNSTAGVEALRSRCRENAARFSEENMINRYQELCQEAVATGGW